MNGKQELLIRVLKIVSEQLVIPQERITEQSSWTELSADSLDRLSLSMVMEEAFHVDIPHRVGERLDTVGETVDYLYSLLAPPTEIRAQTEQAGTEFASLSLAQENS